MKQASQEVIPGVAAISVGDPGTSRPTGWRRVILTSIARMESGHTPSRRHPEYWDGEVPWVGIVDARNHHGRTINDTLQKVTEAGLANSAARWLPARTVCLSRTASVGYVTVLGRSMATSQDFVCWICSDALEPWFLAFALVAEGEHLRKFGKGTVHTTIYFPEALALHLCLPPLAEQRRIVDVVESHLTRLDAAVASLERAQAKLKAYRASVLKAAVEGRLVPTEASLARQEGRTYEPADVLLKRILAERRRRWEEAELAKMTAAGKAPKDDRWKARYQEPAPPDTSDLPELPGGWCWVRLAAVSDLQLGQQRAPVHAAAEEQLPYVRAANITWSGLDLSDVKEMGFPNPLRYRLRHGDVLLSEASGSPMEAGKPAIWRDEIPGACYQKTLLRVRSTDDAALLPDYLRIVFLRDCVTGKFARLAPGVGIVHLTAERMEVWPIPLAPVEEQIRIVNEVSRLESIESAVGREVIRERLRVRALRQAILKWAFEGKLVDQDPNDEPADVLLARIRAERAATTAAAPARRRARRTT